MQKDKKYFSSCTKVCFASIYKAKAATKEVNKLCYISSSLLCTRTVLYIHDSFFLAKMGKQKNVVLGGLM